MAELKRTFTGGKMDKDTDERILQNGLYREALNISVSTSEDSDVGAAQNILGNIQVTEAIQSRSYASLQADNVYASDNYHVAVIVDPQTDMLYRFIHTASPSQGIWMDRIVEFDTSKTLKDIWHTKEFPVFVDIFKVVATIDTLTPTCTNGHTSTLTLSNNLMQIRWGMKVVFSNGNTATVEHVNYTTGNILLNKSYSDMGNGSVSFYGDRNLSFGSGDEIKSITGVNIIDGMIFWTDNASEPKKINIKRSKLGSSGVINTEGGINAGRPTTPIDNFNQHTLLVVNDTENPRDCVYNENACPTEGCTDPTMFNYNALATIDDGSCIDFVYGCTDVAAVNFDATANTDDGSCCYTGGCTDSSFCNYDASACFDDGSCAGTFGCMDDGNLTGVPYTSLYPGYAATNYDAAASCDDGSCVYGAPDCMGVIGGSAYYNNCGTCVGGTSLIQTTISGCDDVTACNYVGLTTTITASMTICNLNANGSIFDPCVLPDGCTDSTAYNYDPNAVCDDGSCIAVVLGCTDTTANNYDPSANTDDGSCTYDVYGCTDATATNYDPLATIDDGSCVFAMGQMTYIPDFKFQLFLTNAWSTFGNGATGPYITFDSNNETLTSNIDTIKFLEMSGKGLVDITGLQDFAALEIFRNDGGGQTAGLAPFGYEAGSPPTLANGINVPFVGYLDMSPNPLLRILEISRLGLEGFDVSSNPLLEEFIADDNNFSGGHEFQFCPVLRIVSTRRNRVSTMDFHQNPLLTHFYSSDPHLCAAFPGSAGFPDSASIDLSSNPNLIEVDISGNSIGTADILINSTSLTYLNVSAQQVNLATLPDMSLIPNLEVLLANDNALTSCNTSVNPMLKQINVSDNQITSMDISNNSLLEMFLAKYNQLTYLNIKNTTIPILPVYDVTGQFTVPCENESFSTIGNVDVNTGSTTLPQIVCDDIAQYTADYTGPCTFINFVLAGGNNSIDIDTTFIL